MDFNKLLNVIDNGITLLNTNKQQRKSTNKTIEKADTTPPQNSPVISTPQYAVATQSYSTPVVATQSYNTSVVPTQSYVVPDNAKGGKFFNDYHVIVDFGKYSGQRIMDLPQEYIQWIMKNHKYGPVYEALIRIENRRGVTTIITDMPVDAYIPVMKEWDVLVGINRPADINPSLYGSFVEFLAKYAMGIRKNDEVTTLLAMFGYAELPSHLKRTGDALPANKRIEYIHGSYEKVDKTPSDLCNLSFAHAISLNSGFNEDEAAKLFRYVKSNESYYNKYMEYIKTSPYMPKLSDEDQETCDKISVGCVIGTIDAISHTEILDIKCRVGDDTNYYRKQLFTYAALHRLRHGPKIMNGKIINFLTGKIYTMDFFGISEQVMAEHIKKMSNHCPYHAKLF